MTTFYERFVKDMFLDFVAGHAEDESATYANNFGLTHAAMGLAGEAGEVVDVIKKHVFTGKAFDKEAVIKEMGDLEFYLEALRQQIGVTREECLIVNWQKLSQRHGDNETIREYYSEK